MLACIVWLPMFGSPQRFKTLLYHRLISYTCTCVLVSRSNVCNMVTCTIRIETVGFFSYTCDKVNRHAFASSCFLNNRQLFLNQENSLRDWKEGGVCLCG